MSDEVIYQRRWWILGVLCLGLLVIALDNLILNVALPTLVVELDASGSQLQWIVDAYVLIFAGLLLTVGSLSDKHGRKKALALGLVVFGIGSVFSAYSGSANQLIASRGLMGVGGAMIMPSTLSILVNVFPRHERSKAIAIWSASFAVGIPVGPILGGWLLKHYWWGSVFLVNIPVIAIALIAGYFLIPESHDDNAPATDFPGAALSIVGLTSLLYAIIEAPDKGWLSTSTLVAFGVAALLVAVFLLWERRVLQPMLDLSFFKNPRFSAGSVSISLIFFALFGSTFLLTQYLQFVLGFSALEAGVRIAPVAIGIVAGTIVGQRLLGALGSKLVVAGGMGTVALALVVGSTVSDSSGYGLILIMQMMLGFGMGNAMPTATDAIMGSIPQKRAGVGSAVNDTTRQVGGSLGVAILGSIYSSVFTSHIDSSVQGLPPSAASAAKDSIGGALGVANQVGGQTGQALITSANSSFVDAMGTTFLVAAGFALLGSLVALAFLPARELADQDEVEIEDVDEAIEPEKARV